MTPEQLKERRKQMEWDAQREKRRQNTRALEAKMVADKIRVQSEIGLIKAMTVRLQNAIAAAIRKLKDAA